MRCNCIRYILEFYHVAGWTQKPAGESTRFLLAFFEANGKFRKLFSRCSYRLLVRFRLGLKLGDTRNDGSVGGGCRGIHVLVCMKRASASSVSRLPNDVQWIGKADRLKSIMLGDYREDTALATVRLDLSTGRPRYPWTRRRVSIQSGWKRYLNMCNEWSRTIGSMRARDRRYQAFYRLDKSAWKRWPCARAATGPMICNLLPRLNL